MLFVFRKRMMIKLFVFYSFIFYPLIVFGQVNQLDISTSLQDNNSNNLNAWVNAGLSNVIANAWAFTNTSYGQRMPDNVTPVSHVRIGGNAFTVPHIPNAWETHNLTYQYISPFPYNTIYTYSAAELNQTQGYYILRRKFYICNAPPEGELVNINMNVLADDHLLSVVIDSNTSIEKIVYKAPGPTYPTGFYTPFNVNESIVLQNGLHTIDLIVADNIYPCDAANPCYIYQGKSYSWNPTGIAVKGAISVVTGNNTIFNSYDAFPQLNITGVTSLCIGEEATLSANITGGVWSSTSSHVIINQSGQIRGGTPGETAIIYQIPNSCYLPDTVLLQVIEDKLIDISEPISLCVGQSITIVPKIEGGIWFSSNPGVSVDNNGTITGIIAGQVYVIYEAANSCTKKDSVSIIVQGNVGSGNNFYIPNSFTPNGDGKNDCFGLKHWGMMESFYFSVFNRWGEKIFETKNNNNCWNGTYKGLKCDSGNYIYIVSGKNQCGSISKTGNIILVR